MMEIRAAILATLVGVILATAEPAAAKPEYTPLFEAAYPAASGSRIDTCSLCHTTVPSRNSYGTAWRNAARSFTAVNGADSDGDGYTNLVEITDLKFPGNAADHPAPVDAVPPTVDAFDLPAESASLSVTILAFTASDNVRVTGYLLTEASATPGPGDAGWSGSAPASYTFTSPGTQMLYAWAKDLAGNVSAGGSDSVLITDTTPPPPPPGRLLLSDFSGATLAGDPDWDRIAGRFGGIRQTFLNLVAGRSASHADDAIAGLAPFGGGRIETKVRFINPLLQTRADVVFDYVNGRNYRFVRLDRATSRLIVGQVGTVGGVGASALSVRVPRLFARLDIWHHLRVDIDPVGGTVKVYVDRATLPALTKTYADTGVGRVGVAATGARRTVAFDNFVVWDTTVLP